MVDLRVLAQSIENKLNNNDAGLTFKIHTDTGVLVDSVREENDVTELINGVIKTTSSDITNLTDGSIFASQTCQLQFVVKLEEYEENESELVVDGESVGEIFQGNIDKVSLVRQTLNNVFVKAINETYTVEQDGVSVDYNTTSLYQFVNSGERAFVPVVGKSFTFNMLAYFFFVENGINTKNCIIKLDGITLPYQVVNIVRTPTLDGNVYYGTKKGAVKNIASQTVFTSAFEMPVLSNIEILVDYIMGENLNQAHILEMSVGAKDYKYLAMFSESSLLGETFKNLNTRFTLVEIVDEYDLITIGKGLFVYQVIDTISGATVEFDGGVQYDFNKAEFNPLWANVSDIIISTTPVINNDIYGHANLRLLKDKIYGE